MDNITHLRIVKPEKKQAPRPIEKPVKYSWVKVNGDPKLFQIEKQTATQFIIDGYEITPLVETLKPKPKV